MSSSFFNNKISKSRAKKRAYAAFSIFLRTEWTLPGFVNCYTCDKHLVLKGVRPGLRVTVGHWIEGHANATYINAVYVRPQCYYCNMMLGGNQGEFRDRIRKELGNEKVDRLLIEAKKTVEISVPEYLQMEAFYKECLKRLTNN